MTTTNGPTPDPALPAAQTISTGRVLGMWAIRWSVVVGVLAAMFFAGWDVPVWAVVASIIVATLSLVVQMLMLMRIRDMTANPDQPDAPPQKDLPR